MKKKIKIKTKSVIILILILLIILVFNYVMVQKDKQSKEEINNIKEDEYINEILDIYVNVPDKFKQYYINNNYESLDKVTEGIFNDPNILLRI